MEKVKSKMCLLVVLLMLVEILNVGIGPEGKNYVYAADVKKENIETLVKQMNTFEQHYILVSGLNTLETRNINKKVVLTKERMAIAAAFTIKISEKNAVEKGEFGQDVTFCISKKKLKKASGDLFGKSISDGALPKEDARRTNVADAYLWKNKTPVVYYTDGETELDYAVRNISIKQNKTKILAVKDIYLGYWGNNNGQSNYRITYQVQKNKKSKYGYVIKTMKIKKL